MAYDRLLALRGELLSQQLTGFVVPHTDEYQNEYLPSCAERLAWLTGFTGSAGTAIVLQNEAAMFVDGRYTLQVAAQVDEKSFSLHNSGETAPHEWLSLRATPTDRIGYDPWLHTPRDLERFQTAAGRVGAQLVPCVSNPIDGIWHDRPQQPSGVIKPHLMEFSGQSSQVKRETFGRRFSEDRIDAAVITAPDSIAWLLNIRGSDVPHTPLPLCRAILYATGRVALFVDPQKITPGLQGHLGPDISLIPPEGFESALEQLGTHGNRVLCDPANTNSWIFTVLTRSGAHLLHHDDPCVLPKACKNPVEIAGAYAAHQRDGVAMCQFLAWLAREGPKGQVTELEAVDYLEACRQKQAMWEDCSFPTISGAGSNGAIVHYHSTPETNRRLEPGTLYLVDSGGQYWDGTTDITRTLAIGRPSDEHRDRYTRVLQGHIALATAKFPEGTTGSQLDALARAPLWNIGLDYDHGTGHGVGSFLGVHEGPQRISKSANGVALKPGMIVSNEPGYYKTGAYGIRLENLVTVVKDELFTSSTRVFLAFDTLTIVPFERALIATDILSLQERQWVDTYHARVWADLQSLVDADTHTWLEQATQPLI
ncbi:MAG TPA: aminopeptidase P family protein [Nitrospirales bacterium]|nr:X-Pro aminopeptidase [Nitrospiraceae bacterium]HNP30477.1 aminopeptidase P family protein [Nitrospirales bacterium]